MVGLLRLYSVVGTENTAAPNPGAAALPYLQVSFLCFGELFCSAPLITIYAGNHEPGKNLTVLQFQGHGSSKIAKTQNRLTRKPALAPDVRLEYNVEN